MVKNDFCYIIYFLFSLITKYKVFIFYIYILMTEFDIVEYDFLKSIIKYDDMENYEKIPSDVIELRKEELNWSLLVTTLLKENRINKDFLLKYGDQLGESEWEYLSEDYHFNDSEYETFLYKIVWDRYLLCNSNITSFEYLISTNVFDKNGCLLNYSLRNDLSNIEIDLNILTELLDNYEGEDKNKIVGNFLFSCIVDEEFINKFIEFINLDYLYYYQSLSTDFINLYSEDMDIDELVKYQNLEYEKLSYHNKIGVFKYLFTSLSDTIKNKDLWINNNVYDKINDLLVNKFNILVYNLKDKTGFYYDYNMKNNESKSNSNSSSESGEDIDDDDFVSYGFLVLEKNYDLTNYLTYTNDFNNNDTVMSNGYYHNYDIDKEQNDRIPKIYIKNDSNTRIYNNIVSNAEDYDKFFGIKLLNFDETTELLNNEENKDKELEVVMVSFDINNCVLFDYDINLTCNKFTVIRKYDRESFNDSVLKDFKKFYVNNYQISLEDSSNIGESRLSIKEKVVSYLENSPDVSFVSTDDDYNVKFQKNPGYKNTRGNEMRLINKNEEDENKEDGNKNEEDGDIKQKKSNFIWKFLGY
jgi:hypothetical protein